MTQNDEEDGLKQQKTNKKQKTFTNDYADLYAYYKSRTSNEGLGGGKGDQREGKWKGDKKGEGREIRGNGEGREIRGEGEKREGKGKREG